MKSVLLGSSALDGAQAEYVRVPYADGTFIKAPLGIEDNALILMGDIFPTGDEESSFPRQISNCRVGYFAAKNAFKDATPEQIAEAVVVLIGCGPVALCALINAQEYRPKKILAVDSVQSRLDLAQSMGAESWNYQTNKEGLKQRVMELTDGRGADSVIEVVGLSSALRLGFDLIRPWGIISSVGVHNGEACLTIRLVTTCSHPHRFHGKLSFEIRPR